MSRATAVWIREAYDRADDYPFPEIQDWVYWRDLGVWQFHLEAITRSCETICRGWAVGLKPGSPYRAARRVIEWRAIEREFIGVTLYRRILPPTREKIAAIERFNRALEAQRSRTQQGNQHECLYQQQTTGRRHSLGLG